MPTPPSSPFKLNPADSTFSPNMTPVSSAAPPEASALLLTDNKMESSKALSQLDPRAASFTRSSASPESSISGNAKSDVGKSNCVIAQLKSEKNAAGVEIDAGELLDRKVKGVAVTNVSADSVGIIAKAMDKVQLACDLDHNHTTGKEAEPSCDVTVCPRSGSACAGKDHQSEIGGGTSNSGWIPGENFLTSEINHTCGLNLNFLEYEQQQEVLPDCHFPDYLPATIDLGAAGDYGVSDSDSNRIKGVTSPEGYEEVRPLAEECDYEECFFVPKEIRPSDGKGDAKSMPVERKQGVILQRTWKNYSDEGEVMLACLTENAEIAVSPSEINARAETSTPAAEVLTTPREFPTLEGSDVISTYATTEASTPEEQSRNSLGSEEGILSTDETPLTDDCGMAFYVAPATSTEAPEVYKHNTQNPQALQQEHERQLQKVNVGVGGEVGYISHTGEKNTDKVTVSPPEPKALTENPGIRHTSLPEADVGTVVSRDNIYAVALGESKSEIERSNDGEILWVGETASASDGNLGFDATSLTEGTLAEVDVRNLGIVQELKEEREGEMLKGEEDTEGELRVTLHLNETDKEASSISQPELKVAAQILCIPATPATPATPPTEIQTLEANTVVSIDSLSTTALADDQDENPVRNNRDILSSEETPLVAECSIEWDTIGSATLTPGVDAQNLQNLQITASNVLGMDNKEGISSDLALMKGQQVEGTVGEGVNPQESHGEEMIFPPTGQDVVAECFELPGPLPTKVPTMELEDEVTTGQTVAVSRPAVQVQDLIVSGWDILASDENPSTFDKAIGGVSDLTASTKIFPQEVHAQNPRHSTTTPTGSRVSATEKNSAEQVPVTPITHTEVPTPEVGDVVSNDLTFAATIAAATSESLIEKNWDVLPADERYSTFDQIIGCQTFPTASAQGITPVASQTTQNPWTMSKDARLSGTKEQNVVCNDPGNPNTTSEGKSRMTRNKGREMLTASKIPLTGGTNTAKSTELIPPKIYGKNAQSASALRTKASKADKKKGTTSDRGISVAATGAQPENSVLDSRLVVSSDSAGKRDNQSWAKQGGGCNFKPHSTPSGTGYPEKEVCGLPENAEGRFAKKRNGRERRWRRKLALARQGCGAEEKQVMLRLGDQCEGHEALGGDYEDTQNTNVSTTVKKGVCYIPSRISVPIVETQQRISVKNEREEALPADGSLLTNNGNATASTKVLLLKVDGQDAQARASMEKHKVVTSGNEPPAVPGMDAQPETTFDNDWDIITPGEITATNVWESSTWEIIPREAREEYGSSMMIHKDTNLGGDDTQNPANLGGESSINPADTAPGLKGTGVRVDENVEVSVCGNKKKKSNGAERRRRRKLALARERSDTEEGISIMLKVGDQSDGEETMEENIEAKWLIAHKDYVFGEMKLEGKLLEDDDENAGILVREQGDLEEKILEYPGNQLHSEEVIDGNPGQQRKPETGAMKKRRRKEAKIAQEERTRKCEHSCHRAWYELVEGSLGGNRGAWILMLRFMVVFVGLALGVGLWGL